MKAHVFPRVATAVLLLLLFLTLASCGTGEGTPLPTDPATENASAGTENASTGTETDPTEVQTETDPTEVPTETDPTETPTETEAPSPAASDDSHGESDDPPVQDSTEASFAPDPLTPTEGLAYQRYHDGYGYIDEYKLVGMGSSTAEHLVIPAEHLGGKIREIDEDAFRGNTQIKSVTFLEGWVKIPTALFEGCTSLERVTLAEGMRGIGARAFAGCTALISVNLPTGLEGIREKTFAGCTSLAEITVPATVRHIEEEAFAGCASLAEITVPATVRNIGEEAFAGCTSLARAVLNEGIEGMGARAFLGCTSLEELVIPASVKTLGESVLAGCSALRRVTLGAGVKALPSAAFQNCVSLAEVVSEGGVTFVPSRAFENCTSLSDTYFLSAGVTVEGDAFKNCTALVRVAIPDGFRQVYSLAFAGCTSVRHFTIGAGGTIHSNVFLGCDAIEEIVFTGARKVIPEGLLEGKSALKRVTLPEGLEKIGKRAFKDCTSLTEVILPEGLVSVGAQAFFGCGALERVVLPASLSEFGSAAFYGCKRTMEVVCAERPTEEQLLILHRVFHGMTVTSADGTFSERPPFLSYEYKGLNCIPNYDKPFAHLPSPTYSRDLEEEIPPLSLTVGDTEVQIPYRETTTGFLADRSAKTRWYQDWVRGLSAAVDVASGELVSLNARTYYKENGDTPSSPVTGEEDALARALAYVEPRLRHTNPEVTLSDYRMSVTLHNEETDGTRYLGFDYYAISFVLYWGDIPTSDTVTFCVSAGGNVISYFRGDDCSAVADMDVDIEAVVAYAWGQARYQASALKNGEVSRVRLDTVCVIDGQIGFHFYVGLPHEPIPGEHSMEGFYTELYLVLPPSSDAA